MRAIHLSATSNLATSYLQATHKATRKYLCLDKENQLKTGIFYFKIGRPNKEVAQTK